MKRAPCSPGVSGPIPPYSEAGAAADTRSLHRPRLSVESRGLPRAAHCGGREGVPGPGHAGPPALWPVFLPSSEEASASPASPLSAKRRVLSRSALRSHQPVARPISMGLSRCVLGGRMGWGAGVSILIFLSTLNYKCACMTLQYTKRARGPA